MWLRPPYSHHQELLPMFAATNYFCGVPLSRGHEETSSYSYQGKFALKHNIEQFKSVGINVTLEQTINRSQKSQSGIIGMTCHKA